MLTIKNSICQHFLLKHEPMQSELPINLNFYNLLSDVSAHEKTSLRTTQLVVSNWDKNFVF